MGGRQTVECPCDLFTIMRPAVEIYDRGGGLEGIFPRSCAM